MPVLPSWRPKKRQVYYTERPEWIEDWVYTEALTAKRFYNENWEFWVWEESMRANVSQAIAEDACIRGLKKALNRIKFVYGDKVGQWYEDYLEMGDIFRRVHHPEYTKQLEGV
jgi:hypothetical protein